MQVENLAIALRIRSNWEAIDLGFTLARQWFLRLWAAWLLGALPVFIIVMHLLSIVNNEILGSFIFILFWWLKPLYEQPLLYILSRQLFSVPVSLRDVFKNYFTIIKPQLGALLLWRRLSLSRSFNNPVAMLENLTGKKRRKRLNVLHAQQSSASQWLTIVCVHLELLLYSSFLLFVYMLIPDELINELTVLKLFEGEGLLLVMITNIAYFIAISIIAPIYVAAGFALYINRRIKLEGWDIELAFKRMKNHLNYIKKVDNKHLEESANATLACFPLLACLLFSSFSSSQSMANENITITKETARTTIEEVLKHEDFGKKTSKNTWVYIGSDRDQVKKDDSYNWLEDFFEWLFGNLFSGDINSVFKALEILIWLAVAGAVIWLINKYSHWLTWISLRKHVTQDKEYSIPNKILGLDMNQASLPDDILTTFANYINNTQYREALSLLYRAALSSIVHRGDVEIPTSATEQECSNMIASLYSKDESTYFKALTQAWIMLAYAHRVPSKETLSQLRDGWSRYYQTNSYGQKT
jgi:hypothetical protein